MKKIMKISVIIVFLFAGLMPIENFTYGQSVSQQFRVNVNLFEIQPVEKRLQLLNELQNDETLDYKLGALPGEIEVFSKLSNRTESAIQTDLDLLRQRLLSRNESLSKEELGESYLLFKENLGEPIVNFAMFDFIDRGLTCANADPFCTSNVNTYPAGINNSAEPGPFYACLSSQPNPAWFYMRVSIEGPIEITMFSTPSNDIDFICWGPFDDPVTPCSGGLVGSTVVDCSYSTSSIERCNIPNAVLNKYYIMMITNYSNNPCDITFQQTDGTGETDCSILESCSSNSPVCLTEQLDLFTDYVAGATYFWTGPNGFSSTLQNPSISNVNFGSAGIYSVVISEGTTQLYTLTTEVEVSAIPIPDFIFTVVCRGEPTVFTDASTINPPTAQITEWEWDFGDGHVATGQNQQYTYQNSGVFEVTLTATTQGQCPHSISKQVTIKAIPDVNAGINITLPYNWHAELNGTVSGGSGNYSYLWEPQSLVVNPNNVQTNTLQLTTSAIFTLSVTDNSQGCVSTDDVAVNITGSPFEVIATATPENTCPGEFCQLQANAVGGSGNYTYLWESSPAGFTSTLPNPVISQTQTTTYIVTVFDGQNTIVSNVTVEQKVLTTANAGADLSVVFGEATNLDGSATGGSGSYSVDWQPASLLVDNSVLQPVTLSLFASVVFTLTITDDASGCESIDNVNVIVNGGQPSVTCTAVPELICQGQSSQLSALGSGGTGNFTYLWTTLPPSSWSSTNQNPLVTPDTTTVYQVTMSDERTDVSDVQEVAVQSLPQIIIEPVGYIHYNDTIFACVHDSVWLDAGPGFEYLWMNGATSQMQLAETVGDLEQIQEWSVVVTDPQTGCQNSDELVVIFDFISCPVGNNDLLQTSPEVIVFPNPTSGSFTIGYHISCNFSNLKIYSANGMLVTNTLIEKSELEQQTLLIDISNYENGVYFMQLQGSESVVNKILIKK